MRGREEVIPGLPLRRSMPTSGERRLVTDLLLAWWLAASASNEALTRNYTILTERSAMSLSLKNTAIGVFLKVKSEHEYVIDPIDLAIFPIIVEI